MNVVNNKLFGILLCLLAMLPFMVSCEIQDDFSYETSITPEDPLFDGTAWKFIQDNAKEGEYKLLEEAIKLTNLQSLYEQNDKRTFVLPLDVAFTEWLKGNNFNSLSEVDVDVLGELLKYNIVKGEYNSSVPAYFEKDIQFEFETEAAGKNIFFSHDSNYRININKGMNIGASVEVYLSNIVPVNGVIHATKVLVEYKP